MSTSTSRADQDLSLADRITAQVEDLVLESERTQKPLEIDPYRSRLFELFVTAHGAGYVAEGSPIDLTADGLCQTLANNWGLRSAAQSSVLGNSRLAPEHLSKMRVLWSMMRMWMEWTYAWQRWNEFHSGKR
jgi:hypothetical protein